MPSTDDPLTRALQPPPNETPAERAERRREVQSAQERSRRIDEALLEDKKVLDKKKRAVKVLLLGACLWPWVRRER
jgi:hypothetical protein